MQTSLGRRGASRCLPSERILRNNVSSAASKVTVMSVRSGEQNPWQMQRRRKAFIRCICSNVCVDYETFFTLQFMPIQIKFEHPDCFEIVSTDYYYASCVLYSMCVCLFRMSQN